MTDSVVTGLDPWRVLLSSLLESNDADEVSRVIGLTGLPVDWNLVKPDDHSHRTRLRAYGPRIMAAYESLSLDDKARVSCVVAQNLTRAPSDLEKLNERLAFLGWRVEANRLIPIDARVVEMFFPPGTPHDAYKAIRDVFHSAKSSVTVIDAYAGGVVFDLCKGIPGTNSIRLKILRSKFSDDFKTEAKKFKDQYKRFTLEVRRSTDFHDRFVVIDDTRYYHIGASIKDAGKKSFFMSEIQDPKNVEALLEQFKSTWSEAIEIPLS